MKPKATDEQENILKAEINNAIEEIEKIEANMDEFYRESLYLNKELQSTEDGLAEYGSYIRQKSLKPEAMMNDLNKGNLLFMKTIEDKKESMRNEFKKKKDKLLLLKNEKQRAVEKYQHKMEKMQELKEVQSDQIDKIKQLEKTVTEKHETNKSKLHEFQLEFLNNKKQYEKYCDDILTTRHNELSSKISKYVMRQKDNVAKDHARLLSRSRSLASLTQQLTRKNENLKNYLISLEIRKKVKSIILDKYTLN